MTTRVGRILGIARHDRPRGPVETVERVAVTVEAGLQGDYRGAIKPGRNKRQVTLMSVEAWQEALRDLGAFVAWEQRRVNLLVEGLVLEEATDGRLHFPGGVELLITGECDPCSRMETVAPGLKAALTPHWRGGVLTRVIAGGTLAVGDEVRLDV